MFFDKKSLKKILKCIILSNKFILENPVKVLIVRGWTEIDRSNNIRNISFLEFFSNFAQKRRFLGHKSKNYRKFPKVAEKLQLVADNCVFLPIISANCA